MSLLGMSLVYVGFVLVINGLWLLDKLVAKDAMIMNYFTGIVTFLNSFYTAYVDKIIIAGAQGLLFSFTYLWVATNIKRDQEDQRALGWYCLMVAITAVPSGILTLIEGTSVMYGPVLAVIWWLWAFLWFLFFLLLGLGMNITRFTAWALIGEGVITGIYGFMLFLPQYMPGLF
ncbi:transporter [Archaeoglobales archaeon]|nr:MAG: transporter [Archaeoglobales archaeon]